MRFGAEAERLQAVVISNKTSRGGVELWRNPQKIYKNWIVIHCVGFNHTRVVKTYSPGDGP